MLTAVPGGQSVACGGMTFLRRGQGRVPAGQQVERAADRRQMLPGDLQVPRGGLERLVAQHHLDRPDVGPRFEHVSRATMAQRMDALAVRDPSALLRVVGDCLGRADGQRLVGIASRQQPRGWPVALPVGAQCGQQAGRAQGRAILPPCTLLDAEKQAIPCAIRQP